MAQQRGAKRAAKVLKRSQKKEKARRETNLLRLVHGHAGHGHDHAHDHDHDHDHEHEHEHEAKKGKKK